MFPRWLSLAFFLMVLYIIYSASHVGAPLPIVKPATSVIRAEEYPALVEIADVESWKRKLNPDYASVMNCTIDTPQTKDGLRFSVIEPHAGDGIAAVCGDTLTVVLTVWNEAGARAFEGEVTLALGSRQLAAGIDFGLLGMKIGAERLLIVPPYALVHGTTIPAHDAARKALARDKVSVVRVNRLK